MRCTVVVDNQRVINREVLRPLLKFANRISARLHHLCHQAVGHGHRSSRIIHKSRLHLTPADLKIRTVGRAERTQFELLSPFLAELQHTFGFAGVALLAHHAVVLRAKALLQLEAAPFARGNESNGCNDNYSDNHNYDQNDHLILVHETSGRRYGMPVKGVNVVAGNFHSFGRKWATRVVRPNTAGKIRPEMALLFRILADLTQIHCFPSAIVNACTETKEHRHGWKKSEPGSTHR